MHDINPDLFEAVLGVCPDGVREEFQKRRQQKLIDTEITIAELQGNQFLEIAELNIQ